MIFFVICVSNFIVTFHIQGQFVDSYDPTIENSEYYHTKNITKGLSTQSNRQRFQGTISLIVSLSHQLLNLFDFLINYLIHFTAFTKVTKINNTDYEVKLVDTAGQDEYSIFPAQYAMVKVEFFN